MRGGDGHGGGVELVPLADHVLELAHGHVEVDRATGLLVVDADHEREKEVRRVHFCSGGRPGDGFRVGVRTRSVRNDLDLLDEVSQLGLHCRLPPPVLVLRERTRLDHHEVLVVREEVRGREQLLPVAFALLNLDGDVLRALELGQENRQVGNRHVERRVHARVARREHGHQVVLLARVLLRIPHLESEVERALCDCAEQHRYCGACAAAHLPVRVHAEEARQQRRGAGVRVELAHARGEQRPRHAAEEAQCVRVDAPLLRPQLDAAQRGAEVGHIRHKLQDGGGDARAVERAHGGLVDVLEVPLVDVQVLGDGVHGQPREEEVDRYAVHLQLDDRHVRTGHGVKLAHVGLLAKDLYHHREEVAAVDGARHDEQRVDVRAARVHTQAVRAESEDLRAGAHRLRLVLVLGEQRAPDELARKHVELAQHLHPPLHLRLGVVEVVPAQQLFERERQLQLARRRLGERDRLGDPPALVLSGRLICHRGGSQAHTCFHA
mmetsp:Transcript_23993/g.60686  ORF Transcript_23993/g.60686 Transcript_23993/m.60686 type:complete len:494 (-) Transcript_23993:48-1529(-)